ncbi:ABC transporter ATP-binding protein [Thalassobaculum fulvum]|uniref:Glutathione import ATP-binding protein GsiA n=1 Tax=Thalassobaculum fulvum TaxID=1633335 RepID=A0A918XWJ5_9PROT|nr:dipeptide ABC transporter ATP-binding protein [Thalassobaculum fulvum]GHD61716.1 ABC transporter ATP-binding protein [Thalassobaculum fulvum]
MDQQRLIDVRDLRVQFPVEGGVVKAVDGVSWHIDRGETLAIVGESGSGKSVSALSLLRLTELGGGRIVSGEIEFRRKSGAVVDMVQQPLPVLRDIRGNEISMIFQEPMTSLNPVFTIGFQIVEAIRLHQGKSRREADELALEMLNLVRMPEAEKRLDEYPHQLSGGMRQRAMIAMSLACRPALLIADEPTTALDVTIQAQILDLIKTLQREIGMAVLFITHDMGVVAEMADRVVVMYRGEKVEEGPVEEIFHAPQHPYTKALLDAVPRLGAMRGQPLPMKFPNLEYGRDASEPATAAKPAADAAPRPADAGPLLEVDGLVTRFPVGGGLLGKPKAAIHAVENISFSLGVGETLALVGESGCGKSTTARTILRLQEPTRGRVVFGGRDITKLGRGAMESVRRQMQMIFQDPFASLNPRLSVADLIGEPLRIHNLASGKALQDRVADLLRRVGLGPEHARRYPHEFSGGQRQRICIARALALNPNLIVADEAVSALDVSIQAQIVNLMLDLQAEFGISYLFVSHDLAVVERISHRVAVMYLGQIVELGPRAAVFEDPRHPYTRKLMSAVPVADPRQRRTDLRLMTDEIPSPLKPWGFEPETLPLEEVSPGHFVMPH